MKMSEEIENQKDKKYKKLVNDFLSLLLKIGISKKRIDVPKSVKITNN